MSRAPLVLFALLMAHGATLGLTDDEAYYWVLAQKPALGYAYHPPMIAWSIAASQLALGWLFGPASAAVVRLPSAIAIALLARLSLRWLADAGVPAARLGRAGLVLLSLAGLSALAWMTVPDTPLFAGWMLAFVATWTLCFGAESERARPRHALMLMAGVAVAALSKFSGVMVLGSAGLALALWGPRSRRWPLVALASLAFAAAMAPVLWWNASHGWGAILYQFSERQGGGGVSWKRFARFWAISIAVAGPVIVAWAGVALRRGLGGVAAALGRAVRDVGAAELAKPEVCRSGAEVPVPSYVAVWILPALIYCMQPLWADFKPHWALAVWWPAALLLARDHALGQVPRAGRAQVAWGLLLLTLVMVSLRVPVITWVLHARGGEVDPRLDVTNDLHGWNELGATLRAQGLDGLPVVGSRYQTASQAAFALGDVARARVTMLPRDLKARDEWPELGVSESSGPDWPRLTRPVLYVADNRYDARPEYPGSRCAIAATIAATRWGMLAKRIDIWKCDP